MLALESLAVRGERWLRGGEDGAEGGRSTRRGCGSEWVDREEAEEEEVSSAGYDIAVALRASRRPFEMYWTVVGGAVKGEFWCPTYSSSRAVMRFSHRNRRTSSSSLASHVDTTAPVLTLTVPSFLAVPRRASYSSSCFS